MKPQCVFCGKPIQRQEDVLCKECDTGKFEKLKAEIRKNLKI